MKRIIAVLLLSVPLVAQVINPPTGGGTPTGPCGGDLGGTFPNCTVVGSHIVSGTAGFTGPVTITNPATSGNSLFINTSSLFGSAVAPVVLQGNAASGPGFGFTNTTYGTNNKTWDIYQTPTSFDFRTSDDANSTNVKWLSAVRAVNSINIAGITSTSGSGSWAHTGSFAATGAVSGNQFAFAGDLNTKLTNAVNVGTLLFIANSTNAFFWANNEERIIGNGILRWTSSTTDVTGGTPDVGLSRLTVNSLAVGNGTPGNATGIVNGGTAKFGLYATTTVCASAASPAVCGSSAAGSVAIPINITSGSLVVNTTAVTASSQILITTDESLGTALGVTCNSTPTNVFSPIVVTARTAGTSFTIANNVAIAVNPLCVSYSIIN